MVFDEDEVYFHYFFFHLLIHQSFGESTGNMYVDYFCIIFLHIYYNIICIRIILLYNILFISYIYIYIFILYHIIISMYWYFYYYHYNCYLDYSSSTICHGSLDCRLPILGTWRKDCKQMILAMLPPLGPATCV